MGGIDDRDYHKVAGVPSTGRPSIYELREPAFDLGAFLDEHLPALHGGRILDAGCGPGAYVGDTLKRARELVTFDIAHNRLRLIDSQADRVCGDVQTLPFPQDTFDAVMAMHMLYHVPDIEIAAAECRRVLRSGGVLYAFTNSERAHWEMQNLINQNGCDPLAGGDNRFTNENGSDYLRTAFDSVQLTEFTDSRLVVTDPDCIVDEIQRNRYLFEPGLRRGTRWEDLIAGVRRDVDEIVGRDGVFVLSERHGLFTCS